MVPVSSQSAPERHRPLPTGVTLAVCATILAAPLAASAQQITGDEVRLAVRAAVEYLHRAQEHDGGWPDHPRGPGGTTALAMLAVINAGVSLENTWAKRGIQVVSGLPNRQTYVVSLKIQALVAADPKRYLPQIRDAANWLHKAQRDDGMWGYTEDRRSADFSNTQFALLGLHEADKAGVRIPRSVWTRAQQPWVQAQQKDGGWSYHRSRGSTQGTGSMTTAGIASLYICGNSLAMRRGRRVDADGNPVCCGRYAEFEPIVRGLSWLDRNWSIMRNPGAGGWFFYYLYGVERVGILSGLRYIGPHDWYREGAARLVHLQQPDGSWRESNAVVDTAFALLFLAKGHRPVMFHKLAWGKGDRWNLTRNDLPHLVSFMGNRLGEPVNWDTTSPSASLEEWLTAPILYFNGSTFPDFDDETVEKLQEYVREGGTILAVGTCDPAKFRTGFQQFVERAFHDYPLLRLPPDHPVFRAMVPVDGEKTELLGLNVGCRTSVFYSPSDIACLWELADVPGKSQEAFELGTNIAAYATGLEPLPDRLDVVHLTGRPDSGAEPPPPPRGALFLAQLTHNGDWRPNPRAILNLADYLNSQMGVDVVPDFEPLAASDPKLAQHPIVYMTGHFSFELPPDQIAALRQHLERGGFLLANACCGRRAFDTSFREFAGQLFPARSLEPLAASHPIIQGQPGVPLTQVDYRPVAQGETADLTKVRLEGITLDDGRTVVVYSPFSLDCGLDGHACFGCRGLVPDDARKVAGNAILYALSH